MNYVIIRVASAKNEKLFVSSNSSAKIVKALLDADTPLNYSELKKRTRIQTESLYTFTMRLKRAGLVATTMDKKTKTVTVRLIKPLTLIPTKNIG